MPVDAGSKRGAKKRKMDQAFSFLEEIKQEFKDQPRVYEQFVDVMKSFKLRKLEVSDVASRVSTLFAGHKDIIIKFNNFLPPTHKIEVSSDEEETIDATSTSPPRRTKEFLRAKKFVRKLRVSLEGKPQDYKLFLKYLQMYHSNQQTVNELYNNVEKLLQGHPDLVKEFVTFLPENSVYPDPSKYSPQPQSSPDQTCPKEDLSPSLENSDGKAVPRRKRGRPRKDQENPSYRPLPDDYVKPKCSGKTPLCDEVLNETYVSVPPHHIYYSREKTKSEQQVFQLEDEQYEMDMFIERIKMGIEILEDINNAIKSLPQDEDIELPPVNRILKNLIERIYGDNGKYMVEKLHSHPMITVPIVLRRLKQKDLEWRHIKYRFREMWGSKISKYESVK
jgi:paired amphipathic helix protein Sin3a